MSLVAWGQLLGGCSHHDEPALGLDEGGEHDGHGVQPDDEGSPARPDDGSDAARVPEGATSKATGLDAPGAQVTVAQLAVFDATTDALALCELRGAGACCNQEDILEGSVGADILSSNAAPNPNRLCFDALAGGDIVNMAAQSGRAVVWLGDGNDIHNGSGAEDIVYGGSGSEFLNGYGGADGLYGGDGNDTLNGGAGMDVLLGGAGNDFLNGDGGRDLLIPGPGSDFANGGAGDDTFVISGLCTLTFGDTFNGGAGHDVLVSPVSRQTLAGMGVVLTSIEQVVAPTIDAPDGCLAGEILPRGCECCDDPGLDPASGCTGCAEGYVDTAPVIIDEEAFVPHQSICQPAPTCAEVNCGPHGACEVNDDVGAGCICDPGYTGDTCAECSVGFELNPEGTCVGSAECRATLCNGNGTCGLEGSELTCICDPGFGGERCGSPDLVLSPAQTHLTIASPTTTLSLASQAPCPGGYEWATTAGSLAISPDGRSATLQLDALEPGARVAVAKVTTTCASSGSLAVASVDLTAGVPVTGNPVDGLEAFDEVILEYLDAYDIGTGATAAIVKDGQLIALRGYGWNAPPVPVEPGVPRGPMSPCSPMRAASVSKYATRIVMNHLRWSGDFAAFGAGATKLDDVFAMSIPGVAASFGLSGVVGCDPWSWPAGAQPGLPTPIGCANLDYITASAAYDPEGWPDTLPYLPNEYHQNGYADPQIRSITLGQLVGHRSGLLSNRSGQHPNLPDPSSAPVQVANQMALTERPTVRDVAGYALGSQLQFPPGAVELPLGPDGERIESYSNAGYGLLAHVAAIVRGKDYFDVLREDVVTAGDGGATKDSQAAYELGLELTNDPRDGRPFLSRASGLLGERAPLEPYYSIQSTNPLDNDQNSMTLSGGAWTTTSVIAEPYSVRFEHKDGSGDLRGNARFFAELLKQHRVATGEWFSLDDDWPTNGGGTQSGAREGTRTLIMQLPSQTSVLDPCLPTDPNVTLTPGPELAIVVMFASSPSNTYVGTDPQCIAAQTPEAPIDDIDWLRFRLIEAASTVTEAGKWPTAPLPNTTKDCGFCGDGEIDTSFGEVCEEGEFGGQSCESYGFAGGSLLCDSCLTISQELCTGGTTISPPPSYADCPAIDLELCAELGPEACALQYGDQGCVGGPCRITSPEDRVFGEAALLDSYNAHFAFHPDGDHRGAGGELYYCVDSTSAGPMTCVSENGWGTCRPCGTDPTLGQSKVGCPCSDDEQCFNGGGVELACWGKEYGLGDGLCYPAIEGPPTWQCREGNCGMSAAPSLYPEGDVLFCEHYAFSEVAACQTANSCTWPDDLACGDFQPLCGPELGTGCGFECLLAEDCAESLGWPANTTCAPTTGKCVTP